MAQVTVDLPDVEGYEDTGEFRVPEEGEYFRDGCSPGEVVRSSGFTSFGRRFILRKLRWRAGYGGRYTYVGSDLYVHSRKDFREYSDTARYECGNYFQHDESAFAARGMVEDLFKSLEENT